MIWFTSDTHFGHENIVGESVSKWSGGYRNFSSLQEMDTVLLDNINKYVSEKDTLYHLGDFSFGGRHKIPKYRQQIRCNTIYLCRGNHDKHIDRHSYCFTGIQDVMRVKEDKHTLFLSHYGHRVWNGSHRGVIHLYGHSHGNLPPFGKSMDVGIDAIYNMYGEYRPISLEEIIEFMEKQKPQVVDHHKERL